jgi:hypothetical protein
MYEFVLGDDTESLSDSEQPESPSKKVGTQRNKALSNPVIPLLSDSELSDTFPQGHAKALNSLIPQCNWRFEHCFLRLHLPN